MIKFLIGLLLISGVCYAEVKPEPQKFETKYVITYNAITLQEAADIEKRVKEQHKAACGVKTDLSAPGGTNIIFANDGSAFVTSNL